ncbi:MAG: glutamate-5-semialdehyde dehydrogenase [Alistipes sp.]
MMKELFENALLASRNLNLIEQPTIDAFLLRLADQTVATADHLIAENARDLAKMQREDPLYDRLLLTHERIEDIASGLRKVAALHSPVGEQLSENVRPNGMCIEKVRVPFGVIGVIYEARPNVSFDVFGLCFKTKNVAILKGSSDAQHSNAAIVALIRASLREAGLDENMVTLLPADRAATAELLNAVGYVDLLIPRGSASLIHYVREHARIPVIETGAGICHTYFHTAGDLKKAQEIVFNAKTRRVSVCNALDCLIVDATRLEDLADLCAPLSSKKVTIYADDPAYEALAGHYPLLEHATENSFGTEFLDYKMAIRTVADIDAAMQHIARYSSKHSEAIITEETAAADQFIRGIDAACVYTNVSTAFTDGGQFGFGAEIGISTQKLHARGPMALPELTTYKYIIRGSGQTRP